jgi:Trm5-related predicted tRNA methylase
MAEVQVYTPLKVDYPPERLTSQTRNLAVWRVVRELQNEKIEANTNVVTSDKTFGELFNDYCEELDNTFESIRDSQS